MLITSKLPMYQASCDCSPHLPTDTLNHTIPYCSYMDCRMFNYVVPSTQSARPSNSQHTQQPSHPHFLTHLSTRLLPPHPRRHTCHSNTVPITASLTIHPIPAPLPLHLIACSTLPPIPVPPPPTSSSSVRPPMMLLSSALLVASLLLAVAPSAFGQPYALGDLCLIFFGAPGYLDYPWATAYNLNVNYTPIADGSGVVVENLLSGTRTFTNKYGSSFTTSVVGFSGTLTFSSQPVDTNGFSVQLASSIQYPGVDPDVISPSLSIHADFNTQTGVFEFVNNQQNQEAGLSDPTSTAVTSSTIPGFTSILIGQGSLNEGEVNYDMCTATISINNGLATRPSSNIGATSLVYRYTYTISDGTYLVTSEMMLTCSSASPQQDLLGNYYQTVVGVSGTRTYTDGSGTFISDIRTLDNGDGISQTADTPQRIYPFSFSSAPPGAYPTADSAPFLDVAGLQFRVDPPAPNDDLGLYCQEAGAIDPEGNIPGAQASYFVLKGACYTSNPVNGSQVYGVGNGVYYTNQVDNYAVGATLTTLLAANTGPIYTACALNADASAIYLFEASTNTLYASPAALYAGSNTVISTTTAATFSQEAVSSTLSPVMVADTTSLVAYVGFPSGNLYAVALNPAAATYGHSYTTPLATYAHLTALTLSASFTTLYYAISAAGSSPASIHSVAVSAGTFPSGSAGQLIYSGAPLTNPNSLWPSAFGDTLFVTDGGVTMGNAQGGSGLSTEFFAELDLTNLTNFQVIISGAAINTDIIGGAWSDPFAGQVGLFTYTSEQLFLSPSGFFSIAGFAVASIAQYATTTAFGLADPDEDNGEDPDRLASPQYQKQSLTIAS